MKKLLCLVVAIATVTCALPQNGYPKPTAASRRYHESRFEITEPAFGLAKVKALIAKIKPDSESNARLSNKQYDALSFDEKFTFNMIHMEDSSQNCDAMPGIENEQSKIFAFCPDAFDAEEVWSERQVDFLKKNRPRVIGLLRSTINTRHRVGANLKQAINLLQARELAPDLVTAYRRAGQDHDILTLLMILMKDAKYKPFLSSPLYKKLYADENSSYKAYIAASPANIRMITDQALAFSKSRK